MAGFKPWFLLPPSWAHQLSPLALPLLSRLWGAEPPEYQPLRWKGQTFKHPVGLAGGVDKNGHNLLHWEKLGASFVEVGTVTPKPQAPNPPPLVNRSLKERALWNQLGFPNEGAQAIFDRIWKSFEESQRPLWINIGKNRNTPNEKALDDYALLFEKFSPVACSYVVNISSPNTKDLRDLQTEGFLKPLMDFYHSQEELHDKPVILKLSPDLEEEDLKKLLKLGEDLGVSGWILGNTTRSRPVSWKVPEDKGGISGAPLASLAVKNLKWAVETLGSRAGGRNTLLVSTGGIMSGRDAKIRLDLGADLVQVYTSLIFSGPRFFQTSVAELKAL